MGERARDFTQRSHYRAAVAGNRLRVQAERPLAVDRDRVAVGGTRDAFKGSERDQRGLRAGQGWSAVDPGR